MTLHGWTLVTCAWCIPALAMAPQSCWAAKACAFSIRYGSPSYCWQISYLSILLNSATWGAMGMQQSLNIQSLPRRAARDLQAADYLFTLSARCVGKGCHEHDSGPLPSSVATCMAAFTCSGFCRRPQLLALKRLYHCTTVARMVAKVEATGGLLRALCAVQVATNMTVSLPCEGATRISKKLKAQAELGPMRMLYDIAEAVDACGGTPWRSTWTAGSTGLRACSCRGWLSSRGLLSAVKLPGPRL